MTVPPRRDILIECCTCYLKMQMIKKGIIQQSFFPKKNLNTVYLGGFANFFKGKGLSKQEIFYNGTEECIHYGELFTKYPAQIETVYGKTYCRDDWFRSQANDVLMPTSDVTPDGLAAASCITKNGVVIGGDILVIRPSSRKLNGIFLSYMIRFNKYQVLRLVTGSTVYHIYGNDMKKFEFHLPPLADQLSIVKILDNMSSEIRLLKLKKSKLTKIKIGMMQQLLTGKIRLIDNQGNPK